MAGLIVVLVIAFVVLIVLARTVRIVPQARAGVVERLGSLQPHARPGDDDPRAVRRQAAAADRPA